ncbi:MAG TPA: PocR ligand-binding domain-containing protein [Anaerolineaceae bacterium]|nr:PocR ligand-binding domain-containing protein [Anaerolineaceae bacterium]
MGELLTTKQLQDLLKVDRITIYRMLNDGRLKGVKIGNQWRFPQSEVDHLLGEPIEPAKYEEIPETLTDFPSDCVFKIQEIFAGIIGVGAITVDLGGTPLTEPSFSNPFCRLMLSNPSSRQACQASWRKIALRVTGQPPFQICHAGLCYQRSLIEQNDQPIGWLVAGQFYINPPDKAQEETRLEDLSHLHNIPLAQLKEAASKIPVLKQSQREQVQEWTPKVSKTVQSILSERADLMGRLQRISEISNVVTKLQKPT